MVLVFEVVLSDYYVYIKDSLIGGSNAIQNWEIKVEQKTPYRRLKHQQILPKVCQCICDSVKLARFSIANKVAQSYSRQFKQPLLSK